MQLRPLPAKAAELCAQLGAPTRLVVHLTIVHDVAADLCVALRKKFPELVFNEEVVLLGAALHDIGKVKHSSELLGSGNLHEKTGEQMLLDHGISVEVARIARFHGAEAVMCEWIECLLVSLADKIWRGRRDDGLEMRTAGIISSMVGEPDWNVYSRLDKVMQAIANDADARLEFAR